MGNKFRNIRHSICNACVYCICIFVYSALDDGAGSAVHMQYKASWKKRFGGPGMSGKSPGFFSEEESGNSGFVCISLLSGHARQPLFSVILSRSVCLSF